MCPVKSFFITTIVTLLPLYIAGAEENPNWNKVELGLLQNLNSGYASKVFVQFTSTDQVLEQVKANTVNSLQEDVAQQVYNALTALAEKDQIAVHKTLDEHQDYKVKFVPLWITNRIYIDNLNWKVASKIIDDVNLKSIVFTEHMYTQQSNAANVVIHQDKDHITWGLQKIETERAWNILGGAHKAGKGVVVGIMDSGFNPNHDLINSSFVQENGWFDPANASRDTPHDWNGHGTHITGTILGKKGIGVAPGATFAACRACDYHSYCPRVFIEQCAQYFICPTKPDGSDPDCTKVVDVVNLSFGIPKTRIKWFEAIVAAFQAARIIPVVAAGNGGRFCKSIYYPACLKDVLTVSSVTRNDGASDFSSWGPVEGNAYHKPDFVAPGTDVKSAGVQGYYSWLRGTSSAAAHVTGLVAILRGKNPEIRFEEIRDLLRNSCDFKQPLWNIKCKNKTDADKPNYMHGYGRINAFTTLLAQGPVIGIKDTSVTVSLPQASTVSPVPQGSTIAPIPQGSTIAPITQGSTLVPEPQASTLVPETSTIVPVPQGSTMASIPQGSTMASIPQGSTMASIPQGSTMASIPQGSTMASIPQGSTSVPDPQGSTSVPEASTVVPDSQGSTIVADPQTSTVVE